jgi:benzodiazapine receptor
MASVTQPQEPLSSPPPTVEQVPAHGRRATDGLAPTGPATPRPRAHRALALAGFAAPVVAAAVLGSRFGPEGSTGRWYRRLDKAAFQPPPAVFAPVWTVLYGSIAYSGYKVWAAPDHPMRRPALALWGTQLAANAAWMPTFFGARRPRAALGVLAVQLTSTVAYTPWPHGSTGSPRRR